MVSSGIAVRLLNVRDQLPDQETAAARSMFHSFARSCSPGAEGFADTANEFSK